MKKKLLAIFLCLLMVFAMGTPGIAVAEGTGETETATVTVNYVYESNQAMVAQPYTAQIEKGTSFQKELEIPKLLNYSVPADKAVGLQDEKIVLSQDAETGKYKLQFNLDAVTSDITVTLYYKAGTAEYKVYHYYQNLEDDNYGEPTVVEMSGDIDAYTKAVAATKSGFHCKGVPETTIAADGTTKVEIYYDRDYYTVTFDVNGGINGPEPIYAKYGTTFEADTIKKPTRKGYTFLGWKPLLSDTVTIENDVTYVAEWKANKGQADYTIVLWGQNANNDEYSYLGSEAAWGNVDATVSWETNPVIDRDHTSSDMHTLACYGLQSNQTPATLEAEAVKYFNQLGLESGKIYLFEDRALLASTTNKYFLYLDGKYYEYASKPSATYMGSQVGNRVECQNEGFLHAADYFYKYEAKTSCKLRNMQDIHPDSALWKFERSEKKVVNADGSTVLNVYFKRKTFTLSFREAYSDSDDYGVIQARWGKNIAQEYTAIKENAQNPSWSENRNGDGPWTDYVGVMPTRNIVYYAHFSGFGRQNTMTYYAEDLKGNYSQIFSVSFRGNVTVTKEDRYEFEGFTYDHGTEIGDSCENAKFYYKRNIYKISFYSASKGEADSEKTAKFEENLGKYDYTPTAKPTTVESDAIFVGWYLNPECTGERYDLSVHTMPANDIALYAKWVNGLYTVKTFTDNTLKTLYTYDGYTGVQADIEKYTLAQEPTPPTKKGYVFVGWFYTENGVEKPFSFTMPITKDYDLYPKFSEPKMVTYTVHYYKNGTTEKVADDRTNSVMIGTTVTEKAKMGTDLNLVASGDQNKYYPTNTSTSVIVNDLNQEIIFYYTQASSVQYTVYYQDANGKNLADPVTKTTSYSTVTEIYKQIPNYAPRQYSIMLDMSSDSEKNKIVFVYDPTLTDLTIFKTGCDDGDENQSFLFTVTGDGTALQVVIHGNGSATIKGLKVGTQYTVTENTNWSWRYTPENAEQIKTLEANSEKNTVTFKNNRTTPTWLSSETSCENRWSGNQILKNGRPLSK